VPEKLRRFAAPSQKRQRGDFDREGEFRALLVSMVDAKRVALFTLGPYARDLSQAA